MLSDEIHRKYFFLGDYLEGRSPDPLLDSIKYEIARQDQVFHFVNDHANKYGSPMWNDGNVYTFGSDKIKVYFIPFAKNNKIEAILAAYIDVVSNTLYYFELLDRKNTDELIKKDKGSSIIPNSRVFVGENLLQGDRLFKEKNKPYYDWYMNEAKKANGLNELETRGYVTICQCQTCQYAFQDLESRSCCTVCQTFWAYTSSGYVGGGGGTW